MPVDEAPADDGNLLVIEDNSDAGVPIVRVDGVKTVDLFIDDRRPRYKSHFATCPDAASFRR